MIPLSSSALSAAGYDPATKRMVIIFTNGGSYTFCGVPKEVFHGLVTAGSVGTYYNMNIRDKYQC